ncbi:alcohol-forming fatty acyl-CoA reductase-like [Gossypium australe]|uniref:Alcohol-forming fatty acyl-CoA reductase-like n=1 Tax=Gossypium australe TaxID=47621 RepID=A0A5B6X0M1_9ROSI|nr:alcohol-forming fatty acyl-CoA reductase-like [Gossypium australe]
MILAMVENKLVRKGCEAYLAYMLDAKVSNPVVGSIHTLREFLDVYPRTASMSIAPYRMDPKNSMNLKFNFRSSWIEGS